MARQRFAIENPFSQNPIYLLGKRRCPESKYQIIDIEWRPNLPFFVFLCVLPLFCFAFFRFKYLIIDRIDCCRWHFVWMHCLGQCRIFSALSASHTHTKPIQLNRIFYLSLSLSLLLLFCNFRIRAAFAVSYALECSNSHSNRKSVITILRSNEIQYPKKRTSDRNENSSPQWARNALSLQNAQCT